MGFFSHPDTKISNEAIDTSLTQYMPAFRD